MAALPPFTVQAAKPPANPATGGHYVQVKPGQFQLIHAVSAGKWAPGPPASASGGVASGSPLLDPNATLSGQDLFGAAQSIAKAQTQPVLQQLAQQMTRNDQQTQGAINQVAGYYKGLGNQAQQGVNQTGQIASGLNSQLAGIGQDEQSQLQGIGQNAMSSLLSHAPQSDATNSLAQPALGSLAAEIARQQGLAAQSQGAFKSFGATQGANYGGLAASNLGTFSQQAQQALKSIAQAGQLKNAPLSDKVAQTQQAYGNDLATALGKLRQQQVTNTITTQGLGIRQQANQLSAQRNQITQQNNVANQGLKAQEIAVTQQNNQANQQLRLQQIDASLNGQNLSHQDRQAALAEKAAIENARLAAQGKGGGAAHPLPQSQNNYMLTQLGALPGLIASGQQHGLSEAQIRANLSDGANPSKRMYNPALVNAAYELAGYGSIDQTTAAELHNMGIRGGTFRGQPIKVTPNFHPKPGGGFLGGLGGAINQAASQAGNALRG